MSSAPGTRVWNDGTVLWQVTDDDGVMPEAALLVHVDDGGTLVVEQEGNCILLTLNEPNLRAFAKLILAKVKTR